MVMLDLHKRRMTNETKMAHTGLLLYNFVLAVKILKLTCSGEKCISKIDFTSDNILETTYSIIY